MMTASTEQTMSNSGNNEPDNDDDSQRLISSNADGVFDTIEVAVDIESDKELKIHQLKKSGSRFTVSSREENVITDEVANCNNNNSKSSSPEPSNPSTPLLSKADNSKSFST